MKVAIYPGSFNPLHQGHVDVIEKALQVFDKVIVAKGINPDKDEFGLIEFSDATIEETLREINKNHDKLDCDDYDGLLKDYVEYKIFHSDVLCEYAIIKGLRNGQDLEYEKNQQYWNEDLGIEIPTFYIIADRKLCHISSSAIRAINEFKGV